MDRRTFLRAGAAVGSTLALSSCTATGAVGRSDPRPPVVATSRPSRPRGRPGRGDWAALRRSLDGSLLLPDDSLFEPARTLYEPRFDSLVPVAVVQPTGNEDVAETIRFARRHGLRLRPRSGGHSYVGASAAPDGILLDLSRMAATSYDAATGTVHVGGGTRLAALHDALAPLARTVPTGTCATVGAGLALGGGIGVESRSYGLTCDSLLGVEVVTADGRVRHVDSQREPALLWACRGGGGGNVGVVTSATLQTWPAEPMGFFQIDFDGPDAVEVLRGWQRRLAGMPRDAWSNVHLDATGDGSVRVRVLGLSLTGDGTAEADAVVAAVGRDPVRTVVFARSHHDGVRLLAGCASIPDSQCRLVPQGSLPRESFVAGSDVLARPLRRGQAAAVLAVASAWSGAGRRGSVLLDPLGGRVADRAVGSTAFPWRDAPAVVQWYLPTVAHPGAAEVGSAHRRLRVAHRAVAGASAGGYVNYLEAGRPIASYYGANYSRMRRVRARYDPTGFFDAPYSVPRP